MNDRVGGSHMFDDRTDAGRQLAAKLLRYKNSSDTILLALPRGGVAVGFELHQALGLPLDVFITRKLRAPENPEFALGALTETGDRFVNPDVAGLIAGSWGETYLNHETEHQREEIGRRKEMFRQGRSLPDLTGRTVLLVDDGIATGSTVMAAVRGLRTLHPDRIVVVTPVASTQAVDMLSREADEVVTLLVPRGFRAVGEHYLRFGQVSDAEVVEYLDATRSPDSGTARAKRR